MGGVEGNQPVTLFGMFVLDVLIEFLIRCIANIVRDLSSYRWNTTRPRIIGANKEGGSTAGSTMVRVQYRYKFDGETYLGTHKEPFLLGGEQNYLRKFPVESEVSIRVNPADPFKSFLVTS
jgi:hypothetical protein